MKSKKHVAIMLCAGLLSVGIWAAEAREVGGGVSAEVIRSAVTSTAEPINGVAVSAVDAKREAWSRVTARRLPIGDRRLGDSGGAAVLHANNPVIGDKPEHNVPRGGTTGACCFGDGICQVLDTLACLDLGGVPQAGGTVCLPDPGGISCEGPCCRIDGTCQVGPRDDCEDCNSPYLLPGTFRGYNQTCNDVECPQPCLPCTGTYESEPCAVGSHLNDGCQFPADPVFEPYTLGDTRCGNLWVTGGCVGDPPVFEYTDADRDYWEVVTTEAMSFTMTVTGELPIVFGLIEYEDGLEGTGVCEGTTGFISPWASVGPAPCDPRSIVTNCLPAGTYWFYVRADYDYDDWDCTIQHTYEVAVVGTACQLAVCTEDSLYAQDANSGASSINTSDENAGFRIFDNFTMDELGIICDIHWWGTGGFNDGGWAPCVKDPDEFHIAFWADDGAGLPDIAAGPVCEYLNIVPSGRYPTGEMWAGEYEIISYDVDPLEPCCSLGSGWVSIQGADTDTGQDCWFMVLPGQAGQGDGMAYQDGSATPVIDIDMSFCLTGDLIPKDEFPSNLIVDVDLVGGGLVTLNLGSFGYDDAVVYRDPPGGTGYQDGEDIATEMTYLELWEPNAPNLGWVIARERADKASNGKIVNVVTDGAGNFQSGVGLFCVWAEFYVESLGTTAYTKVCHPMRSRGPIGPDLPPLGAIYDYPPFEDWFKGDLNKDGVINGLDITCFVECFITGSASPPCDDCTLADMDWDGDIDDADTALFVQRLLAGAPYNGPIALWADLPEPTIIGYIVRVEHIVKDQPRLGACCPDIGDCFQTTQDQCQQTGDVWSYSRYCDLAGHIEVSLDVLCHGGACCTPDGCLRANDEFHCMEPVENGGLGGFVYLEDQPCDPDPCWFACCELEEGEEYPFWSGQCSMVRYDECDPLNRHPAGVTCDTNPCGLGACCLDWDPWCVETGEAYCGDFLGGMSFIPDFTCDPDMCVRNDNCDEAIPITDGSHPFATIGATTDGAIHSVCQYDGQTHNDVWFSYTATCDGMMTVSTCIEDGGDAWYDTALVVYDTCVCGEVGDDSLLGCNDDWDGYGTCSASGTDWPSRVCVPVLAGNCYLIRVGGYDETQFGTGILSVSCSTVGACCDPAGTCLGDMTEAACATAGGTPYICETCVNFECPPPGALLEDACADATPVTDGDYPFTTIGATTDGPPLLITCEEGYGLALVNDIWACYTATCSSTVTVSTCNQADYDTRLAAYLGCDCPADSRRQVGCNDDGPGCAGFSSLMTFPATAGQSYLIRIGGYGGSGTGTVSISCP